MRIFPFLILLLINQHLFSNQDPSNNDLFKKANLLYKEGKFEESIEHYRKLVDVGVVNGTLFFNLGNSHFRTGKIGYAILYYEKARKFIPRDRELNENLQFVQTFTQDRIENRRPAFLLFLLYGFLELFTFKEVGIFVSIIFSITLVCSILFLLNKQLVFFKNLSISLLVIFLFSFILLFLKFKMVNTKRGIVLVDSADVKSAPSDNATLEFIIHEGTEFQILESIKEWSKIKLKDGKTAWLASNTFGNI